MEKLEKIVVKIGGGDDDFDLKVEPKVVINLCRSCSPTIQFLAESLEK